MTRNSIGQSTSATESKGIAMKSHKASRSVDTGAGANPPFEFGKLVNSIMSNPYTVGTGLNQRPLPHS